MNKIQEIIQSYARMVNPTPEQKKLAEIRLMTCMTCEEFGKNKIGLEYCKKCGCATKPKYSLQEVCKRAHLINGLFKI